MPKIEEGYIFEYCQNVFEELDKRDSGYYPSKHDKEAFKRTADHFSISEKEVDRIYDEYTKIAANIEIKKIKKIPEKLRKDYLLKRASDIMINNKDLPFYKFEHPKDLEIVNPLDILKDEYIQLVEKIAIIGWTIPLNIDIKRFQDLQNIVNNSEKLEQYFMDYYSKKEFKIMCRKINKSFINPSHGVKFMECIKCYNQQMYSTCFTTLITILEGVISEFGDNPNDVRVMKICRFQADNMLENRQYIKNLCWISIYQFIKILYKKSDFSGTEPDILNRHWIQHGRSEKNATKNDCLRVFNALSTLTTIKKYDSITKETACSNKSLK